MNANFDPNWQPDPQLLAAYFDGELEGCPDAALRLQIEAWLDAHPESRSTWDDHRKLQKLMRDTVPAEPSVAAWKQTLERIAAEQKRPNVKTPARARWMTAALVAASVLLFVGALFGIAHLTRPDKQDQFVDRPEVVMPDDEAWPVASASEVTVLCIEGSDIDAVIVGTMPVSGEIELAEPGDVCIKCNCPRINVRQDSQHRPMIWAVAKTD
jgi:hypothetical protein